jgi:dipeptidyl aminopeptidase/acylaminoacyl peptidase
MGEESAMRSEECSWKVARLDRGVGAVLLMTAVILSPGVVHVYAAASQLRVLSLEDYYEVKSVGAPVISPNGDSIVYVVSQAHRDTDATVTTLWRAGVDDGTPRAFTHGRDSVSAPAFSPDGSMISFISDRPGSAWAIPDDMASRGQVYVMPLSGGEAFPVTEIEGGVRAYRWSPDGTRLAVLSMPPKAMPLKNEARRAVPIVVTRLKHKYDGVGYLDDRTTQIFDVPVAQVIKSLGVRRGSTKRLTDAAYDSSSPSFSPDGEWIAYESNRTAEPDANMNTDIWKVSLATGETLRVTDYGGAEGSPVFSPDGKWIAFISTDPDWSMYPTPRVMVVPASGGKARNLTGHLDRWVQRALVWAPDSGSIYVGLDDEGRSPLVQVDLDGGVVRVLEGNVGAMAVAGDRLALRYTKPERPAEIYTADRTRRPLVEGDLIELSRANTEHFAGFDLNTPESLRFESADGTPIHAWLLKPPGFDPATRYPLILWIHGGPVEQFTDGFSFTTQYLAAQGYVVLLVNPRGSSGYGEEFSRAIFADWGGPDYDDVMAGVDAVIGQGFVDPERLGVGGYSYGGILTNYVIVKTDRFKGAISAASDANYYGAFGTDDWGIYWIHEFGEPWDNIDVYRRVSPITYIKKAVTPTLFIHGGSDYRDPLNQSEQMYLSLRVLGVETGLIVYPGQSHGIEPPSYRTDLLRRYALWFDKYVKGEAVDPLYPGFGQH